MDVFERVRDVNAGASMTEDRISGARARLLEGIDASSGVERKRLTRHPMFLIAGAVAGAAAVTAGVVIVNQPVPPKPRVVAEPARTVEPSAPTPTTPLPEPTTGAVITESFPGTTPQAGQFLRVDTETEYLNYRDSQGSVFNWTSYQGVHPVSALLTRDRMQLYIPADRSGDWYNEHGPVAERVQFFPGDQSPSDESVWDLSMPVQPEVSGWWSKGGLGGDALPPVGSTESYADLPRDPQALLDDLRARISGWTTSPQEADDALLEGLTFELLRNIAPADVREAYLGALALSGLVQTEASGTGTVSYQFHRAQYNPRTETIFVDEATGWVMRHDVRYDRADGAAGDMVPTTVPDIRTTNTVSIVSSAP